MSSGKLALIRDLGLVKGGKGLRHHERLSLAGLVRIAAARLMSFDSTENHAKEPREISG